MEAVLTNRVDCFDRGMNPSIFKTPERMNPYTYIIRNKIPKINPNLSFFIFYILFYYVYICYMQN
jgi:hypothetical protein